MERLAFDAFTFDGTTGELCRNGEAIKLMPQAARLLEMLLAHPGELVSRETIQSALWEGDTFVDFDLGINSCIRQIRRALGDDANEPRFVETLPKKGYRFVGPVGPSTSDADIEPRPEPPAEPSPAAPTDRRTDARPSRLLYLAVVVGLAALVSQAALWMRAGFEPDLPVTRVEIETGPLDVFAPALALSPDGGQLAYIPAADDAVYIRQMDSGIAAPVVGTQGARATGPSFSPDGRWVLLLDRRNSRLTKVPVEGGAAVTLADRTPGFARGDVWGPDGNIFFTDREELYRIPARGGAPVHLGASGGGGFRTMFPGLLPGGAAILLTTGQSYGDLNAALHDIETGRRRILIRDANYARYVPTGHIVFLRNDVLYAVRFDLERLEVVGEPVPVLDGIHVSHVNFSAQYTFSGTGTLAYVPSDAGAFRRSLVWVDRKGNVEPIQTISRRIANPRISPDGKRVALTVIEGIEPSIWTAEVERDAVTVFNREWSMSPAWSPDGESIAFITGQSVVVKGLDSGVSKAYSVEASGAPWQAVWAPDASMILLSAFDQQSLNLWALSLGPDGSTAPFLTTHDMQGIPDFSPDGRWIAYTSNESGPMQVYAQPVEGHGPRIQISTNGGQSPVWSPDGREIFHRWGRAMMSVAVETEPELHVSSPRVLFEGDFQYNDHPWKRNYDVSPDGDRFLMIQSESEPDHAKVKIVLNWFEELKRLLPVDE